MSSISGRIVENSGNLVVIMVRMCGPTFQNPPHLYMCGPTFQNTTHSYTSALKLGTHSYTWRGVGGGGKAGSVCVGGHHILYEYLY